MNETNTLKQLDIAAGDMALAELEFEQKYILDTRKVDAITSALIAHGAKIINIRQFYDDGLRYRCSTTTEAAISHRENKKSVKLNVPYSVSLEQPPELITLAEFNKKFEKSKKRLIKMRYEFSSGENQKVMVDFFMTDRAVAYAKPIGGFREMIYAVVAEVETILNSETKSLSLELILPEFLKPFLLQKVDARSAASKVFKSANMIDQKENIQAIEIALAELYGPI